MSDEIKQEEQQDGQGQPQGEPDKGSTGGMDLAAEVEKWKNLARKHEQRSKDNADKARRFDEIEEASKTELEKANERAAQAEAKAMQAEALVMRASIAAAKGVPVEMLVGSTQEELEASADRLIAFKGTPPKAPSANGQGSVGESVSSSEQITSRDALKTMSPEEIIKAADEGRLNDLQGIPSK